MLSIIVPEAGVDVNGTALETAALETAVLAGALTTLAAFIFCPGGNFLPCEFLALGSYALRFYLVEFLALGYHALRLLTIHL